MTEIRIHNPIETGFAMVPDVLWRWPGLSFRAKGFMAYLLSFRQGVALPVAAMEAETGLGRDARKAAMRELLAVGFAAWRVRHDVAGRVVAKWLEVTTLPLLVAMADAAMAARVHRAPEKPSHGSAHRAPEKPSDGKSVATRLKTRREATEFPGDIVERETETAAPALHSAKARRGSVVQDERSAREAEGLARAEVSQEAENGRDAMARRCDLAAALGQRVRCPASGDWISAAEWIAQRSGLVQRET